MKRLCVHIAVAIGLLTLAGCPQSTSFDIGQILSTGAEGHFGLDIVYSSYGNSEAFNSDGTYEFTSSDFEGPDEDRDDDGVLEEGWVQTGGERGTYSWDPQTLELTTARTSYFGDLDYETDGSGYDWQSSYLRESAPYIFTHTNYYMVYRSAVDNQWVHHVTSYYSESDATGNDHERIYTIVPGESFDYLYQDLDRSTGGELTYGYQYQSTYDLVASRPEGAVWEPGALMTFDVIRAGARYRYYDPGSDEWDAWLYWDDATDAYIADEAAVSYDAYATSFVVLHGDTHILFPSIVAERRPEVQAK